MNPRTATRESLGTISFRSSSRLPLNSGANVVNPVIFPPGRARLATNPSPTGSLSCAITIGICCCRSLADALIPRTSGHDHIHLETHQFAGKVGQATEFSFRKSTLNDNVFPSTYPSSRRPCRNASIAVASAEGELADKDILFAVLTLAAAPWRQGKAMEQSGKRKPMTVFLIWFLSGVFLALCPLPLALCYLMTLIRPRQHDSVGIVRPICLAVLRLITSSNFVGCSTGQIGRLGSLQDPVHVICDTPVAVREVRAVVHEPAGIYRSSAVVYRR